MNRMKYTWIITLLTTLMYCGCDDVKVGYLFTQNAKYTPDSVVFKANLDEANPDDAHRKKFEIPWQSQPVDGIQGTNPIHYTIERIYPDNDNPEILNQFSTVQKGVIQLPWNHTVPQGKYIVSLRVSNEGYTVVLDSVLTVIVR